MQERKFSHCRVVSLYRCMHTFLLVLFLVSYTLCTLSPLAGTLVLGNSSSKKRVPVSLEQAALYHSVSATPLAPPSLLGRMPACCVNVYLSLPYLISQGTSQLSIQSKLDFKGCVQPSSLQQV